MNKTVSRYWFGFCMLSMLVALAPSSAAPVRAQVANLLVNGNFEQAGANWDVCANAAIIDKTQPSVSDRMVFGGRYAARISYVANNTAVCGDDAFYDPRGQIAQSFTVPSDAEVLTISFRYSRVGQAQKPLRVTLGTESSLLGRVAETDQVDPGELSGWSLYRSELSESEIANLRGRTLNLYLSVSAWSSSGVSPGNDSDPAGYYIDDVGVVSGRAYTPESPRPAALATDGTRPLLYVNSDLGTARMNTDGSSPQSITTEATQGTIFPTWSSDGTRIGLLKTSITQEDPGNLRVNQAFITIVLVTDANGGNVREIYRTTGLPGYHDIPPIPGTPERPALDVEIKALTWSPDSKALALSICATQRYYSGAVNDSICFVEIRDIATGSLRYKTDRLNRLNWGSNNRIIAEGGDPYGTTRAFGIWQIDMNTNPPTETQVVPGADLIALRADNFPTWSPDSTRFITSRRVAGYSYFSDGSRNYHQAIVLFNAGNPIGRTLMVADQGYTPANFTWSPDGKYVLYSLNQGDATDVWWLEVATGATGKVTSDGKSIAASWRPRCSGGTCNVVGRYKVHVPAVAR